MISQYRSPVFIVGLPRSGTTLLQSILCSTSSFFPIPETHFFSRAARGLPGYGLSSQQREKIAEILQRKSDIEIPPSELAGCETKKQAFETVIDRFNPGNVQRFLEKTPRHLFFYDEIIESYPDARFVCLLREPCNSASSILNMGDKGKSMLLLSLAYNRFVQTALQHDQNDNFMIVKYEDLTDGSDAAFRKIFSFIDVPFDGHLLTSFGAAAREVIGERETWKHGVITSKGVDKNDPDKWKQTLSLSEGALIQMLTRSCAMALGYSAERKPLSAVAGLIRDLAKLPNPAEVRRFVAEFRGD